MIKQKRLSIIQNLHQKNSDIQISVDTRLKSKDETTIRRETENKEYKLNYSCVFNNREDGIAGREIPILISKNKDISHETLLRSNDGNILIIKVKFDNRILLIEAQIEILLTFTLDLLIK